MDEDQEIAEAMLTATSSPQLRDAARDVSEALIDGFISSETLQAVPLLGVLAAVPDVFGRVRDAFLRRKILKFVLGVADVDDAARLRFFAEHCATPEKRARLSGLVLHVLDQIRDEDRVSLIAGLFAALLDGTVSEEDFPEFCDLAGRVTRTHVELLRKLRASQSLVITLPDVTFLLMYALAMQDFGPHAGPSGPRFNISPKGATLLKVIDRTPWPVVS